MTLLNCGSALTRAYADDEIPQELIPDPQGELELFDAQGHQVDYRKINKLTDPYNQNILKGDFPIDGKHLYFVFNGISDANYISGRSFFDQGNNLNAFSFPFFENVTTSIEFFSGTTQVFEPKRWDFKLTPVFNFNSVLGNNEPSPFGVGNVQVQEPFVGFQEAFVNVKLADLSPFFDFAAAQVGVQGIKDDFEGFLYNDQNRAAQIFATLDANEVQPSVFFADRTFKDVVSGLNTGFRRNDEVGGGNYILRDVKPGLDLNLIYAHNFDTQLGISAAKNKLNPNEAQDVNYFGAAVQGVAGRFDLSSGVYWATGSDANAFRTGTNVNINAGMGFVKIDYPINYWKPHAAFLLATGDSTVPGPGQTASGWDSINDATNFFGGQFSFFEGNNIVGQFKGTNIFLSRANSVIPSLRNGNQTPSFVNPGLVALNLGVDVQLHPKVTMFTNYNTFAFQAGPGSFAAINPALPGLLDNNICSELNIGFFIRPGLSDDFEINTGVCFTSFDQNLANALFFGQQSVTSYLLRLTTTY
ncbi:MAG: hypothetical protein ACYCW6_04515 [Candidatus Xenobia bacterium]